MPNNHIYWDACCFIEVLEKSDQDRMTACMDLIARAKNKEFLIATSVISLVETNKLPDLHVATGILPKEQSKKIMELMENPFIAFRQVDRDTAALTHELARDHNIKPADAIHVATALLLPSVDVLYTYDGAAKKPRSKPSGLLKLDGLLTHNGRKPLAIKEPPDPDAGTLMGFAKGES